MSILSNAEQIRVETITGANTALRVGGNLVEIANDLITKQTAITANSAKVGITTGQASAITTNTAKTGITTGQASAIVTNSAKVGYTEDLVNANTSVVANTNKVGYTEDLVSANVSVAANTAKIGISAGQSSDIILNTAKTGITTLQSTAISDNTSATATNATAILTKLGKSTSTIAVSEVDVLTAAAYTALATKVANKLYFTT